MTIQHARTRTPATIAIILVMIAGSIGSRVLAPAAAQDAGGVATITGTLSLELAADPLTYVALIDLTGFVQRDYNYVQGDQLIAGLIDHTTGGFRIGLPVAPFGPFNDVAHGTTAGPGVQIYSVDYVWNILSDERLEPAELLGWSWANSSMVTAHGAHEVVGGSILVWTPDAAQQFPTDFGADGKLFTGDDPLGPLQAGWTAIDLDERPFAQNRSALVEVAIDAGELAPLDLSELPATEAFDRLVDVLRARYPFGDAYPIDWEGLRATYRPEFEAAEQTGERADFWRALNHFLIALNNWSYFSVIPYVDVFAPLVLGSTGLNAEVDDDGRVIVAKAAPGQPAEQAGIQAGAELVSWNGKPGLEALNESLQFFSESSPQSALRLKARNFGRAPVGTTIHVEFRNPGATAIAAADLTAVEVPGEDFVRATSCYHVTDRCDPPVTLPVVLERLPSNIAVLRVNLLAFSVQSHRLIADAWDQALDSLANSDAVGLIIDLREGGGLDGPTLPVHMAGSFFTEPFPVADVTSIDENGNDVTVGTLTVRPTQVYWDRPVTVLVDEWCKGICELFIHALKHRPDVTIAGMSATGGSLAGAMESILLPTGNFVLAVDLAYRDPITHEILIQGKGIEPTLRVPKTAETIVASVTTDVVLGATEQALLAQVNG